MFCLFFSVNTSSDELLHLAQCYLQEHVLQQPQETYWVSRL